MWMNFNPVFYVDGSFQTDAKTAALLELAYVGNLGTINSCGLARGLNWELTCKLH